VKPSSGETTPRRSSAICLDLEDAEQLSLVARQTRGT
jgi:hypothetical protein